MEEYNVVEDGRVPDVAAGKVHQFYFVKFYQDQEFQKEFDKAVDLCSQRQRVYDDQLRRLQRDLDRKTSRRNDLRSSINRYTSLNSFNYRSSNYNYCKYQKETELWHLRKALRRMSTPSSKKTKENGTGCEEDNVSLRKSHYRMLHHGANSRVEEKEMIEEMKRELEEERIAKEEKQKARINSAYWDHFARKAKEESSCSPKELKEKIKLEEMYMDDLRTQALEERAEYKDEARDLKNIERELVLLEKKKTQIRQQKDDLDNMVSNMRRQLAEMNACYYQVIMKKARKLAQENNIEDVKELSCEGVRRFMSDWNYNPAFRKDYMSRNSSSLERRQLTKEGLSKTSKRCFIVH